MQKCRMHVRLCFVRIITDVQGDDSGHIGCRRLPADISMFIQLYVHGMRMHSNCWTAPTTCTDKMWLVAVVFSLTFTIYSSLLLKKTD